MVSGIAICFPGESLREVQLPQLYQWNLFMAPLPYAEIKTD